MVIQTFFLNNSLLNELRTCNIFDALHFLINYVCLYCDWYQLFMDMSTIQIVNEQPIKLWTISLNCYITRSHWMALLSSQLKPSYLETSICGILLSVKELSNYDYTVCLCSKEWSNQIIFSNNFVNEIWLYLLNVQQLIRLNTIKLALYVWNEKFTAIYY